MAQPDTIKIKFKATGNKPLTTAIKNLDKATKSLLNSQAKLIDKEVKRNKTVFQGRNQLKGMYLDLRKLGLGFKDTGVSTEMFTRALKGDRVALRQTKEATQSLIKSKTQLKKGMLDTEHSTRILGGSFAVLRSKLLLFNFAMTLGLRQLSRFTKEASRVESMARAFNTLADGGDDATSALDKLKEATDGTMSEFDLFQQANNAMVLGVSQNSDEMAEMFDIAQRLGDALGKDTRMSVESLITGIGRQSRMMLDNIGIVVKAEEAYEKFAQELGISADSLTDTQRKQAFLNATMESAREKVSKLAPEIESTQKIFERMETAVADARVEIGRAFVPIMENLAEATTKFANSLSPEDIQSFTRGLASAGIALGAYRLAMISATIATNGFAFSLTRTGIGAIVVAIGLLTNQILKLTDAFGEDTLKTKTLEAQKSLLTDQISKLRSRLDDLNVVSNDNKQAMDEQSLALERLLSLEKERDALISKMTKEQAQINNLREEYKQMVIQQAILSGLSEIDILRLKFGDEFVANNREIVDMYIRQKQELEGIVILKDEIAEAERNAIRVRNERDRKDDDARKEELEKMKKMARLQASIAGDLLKSALMGRNLKEAIKHAVIHMIVMVVQAKLYEHFMRKAKEHMEAIQTGGTSTIARGFMKVADFLFGHDGGLVTAKGIKRYHSGGLANDEVPAVLQRGEFVLSRNAVESIGLEAVREMNAGRGGRNVEVHIHGGVVQEDYVMNELLPAINKAKALA